MEIFPHNGYNWLDSRYTEFHTYVVSNSHRTPPEHRIAGTSGGRGAPAGHDLDRKLFGDAA